MTENSQNCPTLTYPVTDQPHHVYIWDNSPNKVVSGDKNICSNLIKLNRDYFIKRPDIYPYTPYTFPHPLRTVKF